MFRNQAFVPFAAAGAAFLVLHCTETSSLEPRFTQSHFNDSSSRQGRPTTSPAPEPVALDKGTPNPPTPSAPSMVQVSQAQAREVTLPPVAVAGADPAADERGRALRYLPAVCETIAFADVARLSVLPPIAANRAVLVDRGRALLDQQGELRAVLQGIGDALARQGADWKASVREVGACLTGRSLRLGVLAGGFDSSRVMEGLRTWAQERGDTLAEQDGRSFVKASGYYVGPVGPGAVGIAPEISAIAVAHPEQAGLAGRGSAPSALAFLDMGRPWGGRVRATATPNGEDAVVVETVVHRTDASYSPERDRPPLEDRLDDLASKIRSTPLAPLAGAAARTQIVFLGSTARFRTVLPESALGAAIARIASAPAGDWLALLSAPPLPSVGGGPSPNP